MEQSINILNRLRLLICVGGPDLEKFAHNFELKISGPSTNYTNLGDGILKFAK